MNTQSECEWLLLEDVAREIRAPLSSVRFWCSTGKLPSIRPGRRRLVRRRDLDRFLESARTPEKRESPEVPASRQSLTETTASPAVGYEEPSSRSA